MLYCTLNAMTESDTFVIVWLGAVRSIDNQLYHSASTPTSLCVLSLVKLLLHPTDTFHLLDIITFNSVTIWVLVTLMEVQKLALFKTVSLQRRDTPIIWCTGSSGNFQSGMQSVKSTKVVLAIDTSRWSFADKLIDSGFLCIERLASVQEIFKKIFSFVCKEI